MRAELLVRIYVWTSLRQSTLKKLEAMSDNSFSKPGATNSELHDSLDSQDTDANHLPVVLDVAGVVDVFFTRKTLIGFLPPVWN